MKKMVLQGLAVVEIAKTPMRAANRRTPAVVDAIDTEGGRERKILEDWIGMEFGGKNSQELMVELYGGSTVSRDEFPVTSLTSNNFQLFI